MITAKDILYNPQIRTYIQKSDEVLKSLGYTEHSLAHTAKTAQLAHDILIKLGYSQRSAELAQIAGYMHDIGNVINRIDHAQSSALMAFQILRDLGMDPDEIGSIISAIGNHDEHTASTVNEIAAALILADKSDVRRSRVRNRDRSTFDIHDRVNYAVESSELVLNTESKTITLILQIDLEISSVMDYFEIFLTRMLLCKRAATYFGLTFKIVINGNSLL